MPESALNSELQKFYLDQERVKRMVLETAQVEYRGLDVNIPQAMVPGMGQVREKIMGLCIKLLVLYSQHSNSTPTHATFNQ